MRISDWSSDVCSSDLHTAQALAGRVAVQRAHGTVMAGVHRGEQVETLRAADFAQDDAVGAHAQGVLDEVADGDRALALQVRRAGFPRQIGRATVSTSVTNAQLVWRLLLETKKPT